MVADEFGVDWRYHTFGGLNRRTQWCRRPHGLLARLLSRDEEEDRDFVPQYELWERFGKDRWALNTFEWCVRHAPPPWCEETWRRRSAAFDDPTLERRVATLVDCALYRCAWAEWQQTACDVRTAYLLQLFIDQHLALLEQVSRDAAGVLPKLRELMPDPFDWRGRERYACAAQLPDFGTAPLHADLWSAQEPDGKHCVFVAMVHMLFSKPQVHRCFSRSFVSMLIERAVLYPALWDLFEHAVLITLLGNYEHARYRPPLAVRVVLYRLFVACRLPRGVIAASDGSLLDDAAVADWIRTREPFAYLVAKEMFAHVCEGSAIEPMMIERARWLEVRANTLAAADALRRTAFGDGLWSSSSPRALLDRLARPEDTSVLMYAHEATKKLMTRLEPTDSFLEVLLRLIDDKHAADRMQPSETFLRTRVAAPLGGEERVRAIYTIAYAMRARRARRRRGGTRCHALSDTAFMKAAGLSEHALYWVRHMDVVYRTATVVNYALRESVAAISGDLVSFHILHLLLHLVFVAEHRRVVSLSQEAADSQAAAVRRKELCTPQVRSARALRETMFCNACERIAAAVVSHVHLSTEVDTCARGAEEAVYDISRGDLLCGRRVTGKNAYVTGANVASLHGTALVSTIAGSVRRDQKLVLPIIDSRRRQQQQQQDDDDDDDEQKTSSWKGMASVRRQRIARIRKMYLRLYKSRDVVFDELGRQVIVDSVTRQPKVLVDDDNIENVFISLFGEATRQLKRRLKKRKLTLLHHRLGPKDDNGDEDDDDDTSDDDQDGSRKRLRGLLGKRDEMDAYASEVAFRVRRVQRSGFGGALRAVVSAKARYCREQPLMRESLVGAQMRLGTSLWTLCGTCAQPMPLSEASWTTASLSCGFHERHMRLGAPVLSELSMVRQCRDVDRLEAARAEAAADCMARPVASVCEWCGYDALHTFLGTAAASGARLGPRANRSGNGRRSAFQTGTRPFHRVSTSFGNGLRRRRRVAEVSGSAPYVEDMDIATRMRRQHHIEQMIATRTSRSPIGLFVRAKPLVGRVNVEMFTVSRMVAWEISRIKRHLRVLREKREEIRRCLQQEEQERSTNAEQQQQPLEEATFDLMKAIVDEAEAEDDGDVFDDEETVHGDDDDDADEDAFTSFWDEEGGGKDLLRKTTAAAVTHDDDDGGGEEVSRIREQEQALLAEERRVIERARVRLLETSRRRRGARDVQTELTELREFIGYREVSIQKNFMESIFANEIFEAVDRQCMMYAWESISGRHIGGGGGGGDVLQEIDRSNWRMAFACGLALNTLRPGGRLATGVRHAFESTTYARMRTLGEQSDIYNAQLDDYMPQRVVRMTCCPPRLLTTTTTTTVDDEDEAMLSEKVRQRNFEQIIETERMVYTQGPDFVASKRGNRSLFGSAFVPGVHPLNVVHMRMFDVSGEFFGVRDVCLCRAHHFMVENSQIHHGVAMPRWEGHRAGGAARRHSMWEGETGKRYDAIVEGPVSYGRLFQDARKISARNALERVRELRRKTPM